MLVCATACVCVHISARVRPPIYLSSRMSVCDCSCDGLYCCTPYILIFTIFILQQQLTFRHVFDLLVILDLFDDGLHALEALILERPDDAFGVFLVIAEDEGRGLCTTLLLLLLLLRIRARSGFHL